MAHRPVFSSRRRVRDGLSVLALGMVLSLSGPASAGTSQEGTRPEGSGGKPHSEAQVSRIPALAGSLTHVRKAQVLQVGAAGLIDEVEPNDTTATAQPLPSTPARVRGNLYRAPFVTGDFDVDVYSFTAGRRRSGVRRDHDRLQRRRHGHAVRHPRHRRHDRPRDRRRRRHQSAASPPTSRARCSPPAAPTTSACVRSSRPGSRTRPSVRRLRARQSGRARGPRSSRTTTARRRIPSPRRLGERRHRPVAATTTPSP